MKRVSLVGLGDISGIHREALESIGSVKITAVCDKKPEKADNSPGIPFFTDYREMFRKGGFDCVHICLPHYLHYPVTKEAVEMGYDVFCEKPLAIDSKQADAFSQLEQEHPERKIAVCLQNRYNASSIQIKRIIDSGEDGNVLGIRAMVPWSRPKSYYEAAPWRGTLREAGSGVLANQSVHTLDLMRYFGGPVRSLRGSVSQLLDYGVEVEDTACARMEFSSGAIGQFFATNACERNTGVEIEINLERADYVIRDSHLFRRNGNGYDLVTEDEKMPGKKFYYGASHLELIRRFYRCLEQGGEDYPNVASAVDSIRLIDAILESSRTGKTVLLEVSE